MKTYKTEFNIVVNFNDNSKHGTKYLVENSYSVALDTTSYIVTSMLKELNLELYVVDCDDINRNATKNNIEACKNMTEVMRKRFVDYVTYKFLEEQTLRLMTSFDSKDTNVTTSDYEVLSISIVGIQDNKYVEVYTF